MGRHRFDLSGLVVRRSPRSGTFFVETQHLYSGWQGPVDARVGRYIRDRLWHTGRKAGYRSLCISSSSNQRLNTMYLKMPTFNRRQLMHAMDATATGGLVAEADPEVETSIADTDVGIDCEGPESGMKSRCWHSDLVSAGR